jgi:hypothetical protein
VRVLPTIVIAVLLAGLPVQGADDHGEDAWSATPTDYSNATPGVIDWDTDEDWFAFEAETLRKYALTVQAETLWDATLVLVGSDGTTVLGAATSVDVPNARVVWTNMGATDTFYVHVGGFADFTTGSYALVYSPTAVDIDDDGLPDFWEILTFSTLTNTAEGDFDGDGYTNGAEYEAETDPLAPDRTWPDEGVAVSNWRPRMVWVPTDGATWYYLWINRNGSKYFSRWLPLTRGDWRPDFDFEVGDYTWWVRPWGPAIGFQDWSSGAEFHIPQMVPEAVTLLGPQGTLDNGQVTYRWEADRFATWYYLWVNRDDALMFRTWLERRDSYPAGEVPFGNYQWWVRPWCPGGYGPWSSGLLFNYGHCAALSPSGSVTAGRRPDFLWTQVNGATWYGLLIQRNGEEHAKVWVQGGTTWQDTVSMPYGDYTWWVRGWKPDGPGPWSDGLSFDVGKAVPVAPAGLLGNSPAELQWDDTASGDSTWYNFRIENNGVEYWGDWVERADTMATNGSVVAYPLPVVLPEDTYTWQVQTYDPAGLGPWSDEVEFTVGP